MYKYKLLSNHSHLLPVTHLLSIIPISVFEVSPLIVVMCFYFFFVAFNLDFYTEVLDLNFLLEHIKDDPFSQKYKKLNEALVSLVEDYGLVSFKTLDVQVRKTFTLIILVIRKE